MTVLGWALATLAFAGTPQAALSACDDAVVGIPQPERDYGCYNRVAFEDAAPTLAHLEALLQLHEDDGRLWLTYGSIAGDQGHNAKPAFRTAIALLKAADLPRYQIQAQLNLARGLAHGGQEMDARAVLRDAAAAADTLGHPLLSAVVEFELLGLLAVTLDGDVLGALEHAAETYDGLGKDTPYQVRRNAAAAMARGYRALGLTGVAARWSERSRVVSEEAGDRGAALRATRAVARDRWRANRARYAADAHRRFRGQAEPLLAAAIAQDNPWAELMLRIDMAQIAEPEDALAQWEDALALAVKLDKRDSEVLARGELALLRVRGAPQTATEQIDALVASFGSGALEEGIYIRNLAGKMAVIRRDMGRAWALWDAMLGRLDRQERAQGDEGRALLRARDLQYYRMVSGSLLRHTPQVLRWNRRAFAVMERMRGRELAEFSRSAQLDARDRGTRVTLDEVMAALAPTQAMLMFQVGEEDEDAGEVFGGSWLLVVTRTSVRRYPLPAARLLEPAAAMVAASFTTEASTSGELARAALYEMLLEQPLADLPGAVHDLVVVLDGHLHRVPLAALGPRRGAPVLSRFGVSTASSATAWLHARATTPLRRDLLVLGDPKLAPGDPLAPLPGARAESQYLKALFGSEARVLLGERATEAALADAPRSGVLHVAAHAVVDRLQPHRSRVALAGGNGEDGDVSLQELSVVPLDGTVVMLAACHGADGELLAGEGPLSAARALSAAGATAVVASLWPVDDRESAGFFAELYAALDQGLPLAAAVTRAQARRRVAGTPLRGWAGFVVYGDGAVRLGQPERSRAWLWMLLAAVSGGGLSWVLFGLRRVVLRTRG